MAENDSTTETPEQRAKRMHRASAMRSYWRKRGVDIPLLKHGPKNGYKQTPEHIEKRMSQTRGESHWLWKGDAAHPQAGRNRALRKYKNIGPCVNCGCPKAERHHRDGNTRNNDASNIKILCRLCHQKEDGRYAALKMGLSKWKADSRLPKPCPQELR